MSHRTHITAAALAAALALTATAAVADNGQARASSPRAANQSMLTGLKGWDANAMFTTGDRAGGYQPVGVFDGLGTVGAGSEVTLLANHELNPGAGRPYTLPDVDGELTGARISRFDVHASNLKVQDGELAYDRVYDRAGALVTHASQINETGSDTDGFARFCSGRTIEAGQYGFVDDVHFAGEETGAGHGGTFWALDVAARELWAAPDLGRGAWENLTPIAPPDDDHVALVLGDDTAPAPLYLYVGEKDDSAGAGFLERNGLVGGELYALVVDGVVDPTGFKGTGNTTTGTWVAVDARDEAMAGAAGYDDQGYKDIDTLQDEAFGLGAFHFSRPEDVHENPADPMQFALNSTGRSGLFGGVDTWGTTYVFDLGYDGTVPATAAVQVLHDADDTSDFGPRSMDNLVWAHDGHVYVQEDAATGAFGTISEEDASIWQLDPSGPGHAVRIAQVDRDVVRPKSATDTKAGELGAWETSGIIDVTDVFPTPDGTTRLLLDVQAHGVTGGVIDANGLVESSQLVVLTGMP